MTDWSEEMEETITQEEIDQREARGNQPITKQELEDKINVWMIKCEEMK